MDYDETFIDYSLAYALLYADLSGLNEEQVAEYEEFDGWICIAPDAEVDEFGMIEVHHYNSDE